MHSLLGSVYLRQACQPVVVKIRDNIFNKRNVQRLAGLEQRNKVNSSIFAQPQVSNFIHVLGLGLHFENC